MGLRVRFNARQLEANLDQLGQRAMENGSRSLRRIADRIEKLAIAYAPVDDGDLESSIKQLPPKKDDKYRNTYTVIVDGNTPAKSDEAGNVTKRVGDYALLVERYLEPYGRWHRGKGSLAKDGGRGVVGGGFFDRAVREATERALKDVGDSVRAAMRSKYSTGAGGSIMSRSDYRARRDQGDEE